MSAQERNSKHEHEWKAEEHGHEKWEQEQEHGHEKWEQQLEHGYKIKEQEHVHTKGSKDCRQAASTKNSSVDHIRSSQVHCSRRRASRDCMNCAGEHNWASTMCTGSEADSNKRQRQ